MGVVIPQVIAEDRASGAQIIDGSLKFDDNSSHYLNRTPLSAGNQRTFTWSGWIKRSEIGSIYPGSFGAGANTSTTGYFMISVETDEFRIFIRHSSGTWNFYTNAVLRDTSSWYHIVVAIDTTAASSSDRAKVYINGVEQTFRVSATITQNFNLLVNTTAEHTVGAIKNSVGTTNQFFPGHMSQVYLIDGQALGPEYFGFTDPLTNTWRPKKYEGTFGINGFYLPMDGNSPIGEDKSGNGNDWTPVSFGGSNTIEKATGALPILNTVSGGKIATVGVRTDATVAAGVGTCVLALPFANPGGSTEDVSNQIDSRSTEKVITASGNAVGFSTNNFYGRGWYFDGQSTTYVQAAASNDFVVGTGDFTIEGWFNPNATQGTNGRLWGQQNPGTTSEANADYDCYIGGSFGTSDIQMNGGNTDLGMNFPTAEEWHHIAVCRSGTNLYSFMNGVLKKITPNYTNNLGNSTDTFRVAKIGGNNTGYAFAGGVQDFRFYNGVAKYTSDFIPASINPDILPDTPSGISGGSELAKIANGSVGFAGTSRLSIANSNSGETELGTDPFTMEAWVYKNSDSANPVIASKYTSASRSWYWSAGVSASDSNQAFYYYYGINGQDGTYSTQTAGAIPVKKWTHCAVSRDSNDTIRLFIDGKHTGTINITDSNASATSTPPMELGMDSSNADGLDGMISNFRFVKGTALYTSDFTPPTEPLTNITNTKLLCAQSASEHKDITGRLYKSDTLYTTRANIIANATPLEGGETLNGDYLYYVPSGNELTRQQVFSADGGITNGDSSNSWSWMRHDSINWISISGGYNPGQFDEFYFDADDTSYQLDPTREFYALTLLGGTSPSLHGGTAPTLRKQFVLDAAVIPFNSRRLIDQLYEPTVSNFNPFTTDINTVRGQETGYCTLNPLNSHTTFTLSNGNLEYSQTTGGISVGTIGVSSGKWYWEYTPTSSYSLPGLYQNGDLNMTYLGATGVTLGFTGGAFANVSGGISFVNNITFTIGDIIGFVLDMDAGKLTIYKNGIASSLVFFNLTGTWFPAHGANAASTGIFNFGQTPFKFPPPDGYGPVNAANIRPETVIARPDQYVGVTTYISNNNTLSVSDYKFQPDLLIFKNRDTANHWGWFDSVRGPNKWLRSSGTNDESTTSGSGYGTGTMNSFDSNGFTLGDDVGANVTNYPSGNEHVVYGFKAGGNPDPDLRCTTRMTGDIYPGEGSYENLFDGSVGDGGTYALPDPSLTWSPTNWTGANSVTSFRINATHYTRSNGTGTLSVVHSGGTVNITVGGGRQWYDVYTSGTNYVTDIQSVTWTKAGSAGSNYIDYSYVLVFGFEINGTVVTNTACGPAPVIKYRVDDVGYATTTAAGLTAGDIPPTGASIGTKQGFSIVTFTSPSSGIFDVPHGLSQTPDFVISKSRTNSTAPWYVYHKNLATDNYLRLNETQYSNSDGSNQWGNGMTSSVVGLKATFTTVADADQLLYVWHDVPGLQKFGNYVGNADNNGTFVELGFRPALLWIKRMSDGTNGWYVVDTEKSPINLANDYLYLNSSNDDSGFTNGAVDILSNGFKMRANTQATNNSATYIYAAWAEAPSINLYGGQSNAR